MNVQEGPEWEIASHLLSDLRSVLHNQALSVETLVLRFNAFDFSLLSHKDCAVRKASVVFIMVLLKIVLKKQQLRAKSELLTQVHKSALLVDAESVRKSQLQKIRCQSLKGPLIVESEQTFVLHASNSLVKNISKTQINRFLSDRQYFSYLLQRSDGSTIQLGLEADRCESLFTNPGLLQTIPDPLLEQIFTTIGKFSEFCLACPIEFVPIPTLIPTVEGYINYGSATDRPSQRPSIRADPQWFESTPGRKSTKLITAGSLESVEHLQSPVANVHSGVANLSFTDLQRQVGVKASLETLERGMQKSFLNRSTRGSLNRTTTPGLKESSNYKIRLIKVLPTAASPTLFSASKSPKATETVTTPKEDTKMLEAGQCLIMRTKSRSPFPQSGIKDRDRMSRMRSTVSQSNTILRSLPKGRSIHLSIKSLKSSKPPTRRMEASQKDGDLVTPNRRSQLPHSPVPHQTKELRSCFVQQQQRLSTLQILRDSDSALTKNFRPMPTQKGFFVVRSTREWLEPSKIIK